MDPRQRADAALARARARGSFVVTPDNMVSPMDAVSTVQIPRSVIAAADPDHSDNTQQIPGDVARGGGQYQQTQPVPQAPQQQATQPVPAPQQPTQPVPQPGSHFDESQPTQPVHRPQPQQNQPQGQQQQQYQPPQYAEAQQQYQEQQQYPEQRYPEDEQQPQPREVGGLVPTVQQPGNHRSMLSRRLDGD